VALFFDKSWFDQTLRAQGLTRADLAQATRTSQDDLAAMFKDQMEVPASHVQAWAALLGQTTDEIALRCGVSTRVPQVLDDSARIAALEARVAALEALVAVVAKQQDATILIS
jgi:cyanate lyase